MERTREILKKSEPLSKNSSGYAGKNEKDLSLHFCTAHNNRIERIWM